MALQLRQAVGRGARRVVSTSGIVALALTVCQQVVFVGSVNALIVDRLPTRAQTSDAGVGFVLPLPTESAAIVVAATLLLGTGIFVVMARLFVRNLAALSLLPRELFTRRIGRALLSALVINVVLAVVIPVGLALLFLPGLFLAVSLQFALFAVAVEDTGPLQALRRSWNLASGNRWRLLALVGLFGVFGAIGGTVGALLGLVSPSAGQFASLIVNSALVVTMYGIIADSFVQLRGDSMTPRASPI